MTGELRHARRSALLVLGLLAGISFLGFRVLKDHTQSQGSSSQDRLLSGQVHDAAGPVAGATVRFKGELAASTTDLQGRFHLARPRPMSRRLTASKEGYLIAGIDADSSPLSIRLSQLPSEDSRAVRVSLICSLPNSSEFPIAG